MSYEQDYTAKLESIILAMGGVVPMVSSPTNFQKRSLELLDVVSTSTASSPLVGSSTMLPYPVTLSTQTYTDPAGWLWYAPHGGSIGDVGSGSTAAIAKLEQLFAVLWSHILFGTAGWSIQTNTGAGSVEGVSAAADWAAGKRLLVPDQRGRSLIAAGQGSGLTNRVLGTQGGAETHALGSTENAPHDHSYNSTVTISAAGYAAGAAYNLGANSVVTGTSGSGAPHNNMQPWSGLQLLWFSGVKG